MFKLTLPSPLYPLKNLSKLWGIELWIKRDDLIPQFFGGNKVRKNSAILKAYCEQHGKPDVLITNGGANSNHARVSALMAHQLKIGCELVLHGGKPSETNTPTNLTYSQTTLARYHYVKPEEIQEKIQHLENSYKSNQKQVFVLPGGGHTLTGAKAYESAVSELTFAPDYIVLASGTGGTQAGILRGVLKNKIPTQVIGISIARTNPRGAEAVAALLDDYTDAEDHINFHDEFTFGGYEKSNNELLDFVRSNIALEGIPLDCTYTGKAMYGLSELIKEGRIPKKSKVVFWHTGGLFNFQDR